MLSALANEKENLGKCSYEGLEQKLVSRQRRQCRLQTFPCADICSLTPMPSLPPADKADRRTAKGAHESFEDEHFAVVPSAFLQSLERPGRGVIVKQPFSRGDLLLGYLGQTVTLAAAEIM